MKVFFVMVLVLVAGAVPSHGRTESEGTAFNKTQPHESMNNVTISSSKLANYNLLCLAMQWPKSYCNHKDISNCKVSGRFTVHGLWPQFHRQGINCTDISKYGQYPPFRSGQLCPSQVDTLNSIWPDLRTRGNNNEGFWADEYKKHGSCTFNNQRRYFERTITLVEHLGFSPIRGSIITPGRYRLGDIERAVYGVTHKRPWFVCIEVGNSIQLLEIRFCFDRISYEPIDCYRVWSLCENRIISVP